MVDNSKGKFIPGEIGARQNMKYIPQKVITLTVSFREYLKRLIIFLGAKTFFPGKLSNH